MEITCIASSNMTQHTSEFPRTYLPDLATYNSSIVKSIDSKQACFKRVACVQVILQVIKPLCFCSETQWFDNPKVAQAQPKVMKDQPLHSWLLQLVKIQQLLVE